MSHRNFSKFLFAGLSLVSLGTSIFVACSDKELPFGEDTSVGDTSVGDGDTAANPLFDGSTNLPDGSTLLPDGAIALPDGGVLTAREACVRMQVAKCARALQCEKGNPSAWPEVVDPLLTLYASPEPRLEECVKRYLSRCEFYLLPGSSIPLQQLLQCEAARSAQSCEELTAPHPIGYHIDENGNTFDRYNTPAACRFFGNRTPGDKCIANSQCASGTCAPPTISDGGTCGAQCLAPLPRGASCLDRNVRTPACSVGLECIDNPDGGPSVICETPNVPKPGFDEGSPCTVGNGARETTCKREVPCTSSGPNLPAGLCKRMPKAGEACAFRAGSAVADLCDFGASCVNGTCKAGIEGAYCSAFAGCGFDYACRDSVDGGRSTCRPGTKKLGEDCNEATDTLFCEPGLVCAPGNPAGKCALPTSVARTGELCDPVKRCAEGTCTQVGASTRCVRTDLSNNQSCNAFARCARPYGCTDAGNDSGICTVDTCAP